MPVIVPSAVQYADMLKQLLPPSRYWRLDPDSNISRVLLGCADELARISGRVRDLLEELDPRTTDELLPDFERLYAIDATGTEAERRAFLAALVTRRPRARPVDFQQVLAPLLGQDADDVVIIERTRAQAIAMDDDREIYRFFIYRDPDLPGLYDVARAQEYVDRMAPSHTKGHVIESIDFLCDDPFSLCDRDLLGV